MYTCFFKVTASALDFSRFDSFFTSPPELGRLDSVVVVVVIGVQRTAARSLSLYVFIFLDSACLRYRPL